MSNDQDSDMKEFLERERALEALFTREKQLDPLDEQGIAFWARSLVLHVQDRCAKRAQYGDFITGMGCRDGFAPNGEIARARKKAADDIRALRWGPDYATHTESPAEHSDEPFVSYVSSKVIKKDGNKE